MSQQGATLSQKAVEPSQLCLCLLFSHLLVQLQSCVGTLSFGFFFYYRWQSLKQNCWRPSIKALMCSVTSAAYTFFCVSINPQLLFIRSGYVCPKKFKNHALSVVLKIKNQALPPPSKKLFPACTVLVKVKLSFAEGLHKGSSLCVPSCPDVFVSFLVLNCAVICAFLIK